MTDSTLDAAIRRAAFNRMAELTDIYGEELPWDALRKGFAFRGERISLASMRGIFKPRMLDAPLSLRTGHGNPYRDSFLPGGNLVAYDYFKKDPEQKDGQDLWHRDNIAMRRAWHHNKPLIYLYGIARGRYLAAWPVTIERREDNRVILDVDGARHLASGLAVAEPRADYHVYRPHSFSARAHRRVFRERVLAAYRRRCAMCSLAHVELLDAARIVPAADTGEPRVSNGIALCKLHHAAFDRHLLGINPGRDAGREYRIEVRRDLLAERDGPMLRHGLQEMHGGVIWLPPEDARPDRAALESRYDEFLKKAG